MEEGVLVMVMVTAELLPLISTGVGRCCCCVVFTLTKAELHWGHYWCWSMQGPGRHETIASLLTDASVIGIEDLLFHLFEIET